MSQSLHPMLNIAIKAARAAGAVINRGSQDLDLLTITSKGPNDFVSEVDKAAEQVIIETLLQAYPGHGILAEESGRAHGAKDSDFVWIIDPLDGTTNFLHGLPIYAVSIALAFRGKVEQAVVYDPNRNDLFYASRGRGAFLNDKRLRVSKRTRLVDSLVGTGFPFRKGDNLQRYLKMFETVMAATGGMRRTGSAALDLCYVAAGWYDGFFETGLSPWDIAAGSLLITEAGGLCGNFTGEADFMYQRELVCGTPKVYGQLVTLLAPYSRAIKADEAATDGEDPAATGSGSELSPGAALAATMARSVGADSEDAASPAAPAEAPANAAARERKPVRIRKAAVATDDAADASAPAPDDAAAATDSPAADAPPAPRVLKRIPRSDVPPAEGEQRPAPRRGAGDARGPRTGGPGPYSGGAGDDRRPRRPDGDRPRGPRPSGDRADWGGDRGGDRGYGARPEGDRPRGPRQDARGPAPARKTAGGGTGGPRSGGFPAKAPRKPRP